MLSIAVKICEQHYNFKDASSCDRCPISTECRSGCGYGQEGLDSWRKKLESAAIAAMPLQESTN